MFGQHGTGPRAGSAARAVSRLRQSADRGGGSAGLGSGSSGSSSARPGSRSSSSAAAGGGGGGGAGSGGAGVGGGRVATRLVSRREFNRVLEDMLSVLAVDKHVGREAQAILDPSTAEQRAAARYARTRAGKQELAQHIEAVRARAEEQGVEQSQLSGTIQNDILKEIQAAEKEMQE